MRRTRFALLTVVAACCGCASHSAPPFESPLLADSDDPIRQTPIIDIHAHTFNATMLPLEGIALGKRDAFWFLSFITDQNARCLATYISLVGAYEEMDWSPLDIDQRALARTAERQGLRVSTLEKNVLLRAVRHQYLTRCGLEEEADAVCPDPKRARSTFEQFASSEFDIEHAGGVVQLLDMLLRARQEVPLAYLEAFEDHPDLLARHERGLMVSQSLDFGPVYNEHARPMEFLDYESEQLDVLATQQKRSGGRMIYFVGYNPFRDTWPHESATPGDALRIVEKAIDEHGAFGVKFYPPSGFRATDNEIPGRPWAFLTPFPHRQWEARSMKRVDGVLVDIRGDELDARIEALLDYCVANDLPVFAHCNTGEFEARKGYGKRMAGPEFWERYLSSNVDRSTLRLCLGHAGGAAYWFGTSDRLQRAWGRKVFELCTTYPNVYCEIGVHGDIREGEEREHFIALLAEHFQDDDGFQSKIMYGSDWFMPSGSSLANYFDAYEHAFLDERLRPAYRDFFLNNALQYLNASARLDDERLPDATRARLRDLLAASDVGGSAPGN